jgi:phosphoglycerate dehydrogenase-like enzyme
MTMAARPSPAESKILLCVQFHFSFWRIPPELPAAIRARWPESRVVHLDSYDVLPGELPDTDIFIGFNLLPAQLAVARKLKWIHITSAGVSQLMRPDVRATGITITNSRGIHAIPMAEHTMGLLLMLARRIPETMRFQSESRWAQQEILEAHPAELRGATLLIVGFGGIGTELARLARAFGMRILAVTRTGRADSSLADETFSSAELSRALPQADYVVLCAPDTPDTQHMIGAAQLASMKRSASLLNIARGSLVDEAVLINALENGTIAAAALDVAQKEPLPPESPLWKTKNLLITPHTSSVSERLWPRQIELTLEDLECWFSGKELLNLVDFTRGY